MRLVAVLFPALLWAQIDTSKLVDLTWPFDEKTIGDARSAADDPGDADRRVIRAISSL